MKVGIKGNGGAKEGKYVDLLRTERIWFIYRREGDKKVQAIACAWCPILG